MLKHICLHSGIPGSALHWENCAWDNIYCARAPCVVCVIYIYIYIYIYHPPHCPLDGCQRNSLLRNRHSFESCWRHQVKPFYVLLGRGQHLFNVRTLNKEHETSLLSFVIYGNPKKTNLPHFLVMVGKGPRLHVWGFHELELVVNTVRGGFLVTVLGFVIKRRISRILHSFMMQEDTGWQMGNMVILIFYGMF